MVVDVDVIAFAFDVGIVAHDDVDVDVDDRVDVGVDADFCCRCGY